MIKFLIVDVEKYKPYSPFQNTSSRGEWAVARLDDIMNWGRKVRCPNKNFIFNLTIKCFRFLNFYIFFYHMFNKWYI